MRHDSQCDKVLSLLRKIMQSVDVQSRNLMKRYGMTVPQILLLKEVCRHKEPISAAEIAKEISLNPATIAPIVDKLIKKNYITRMRSTEDKRILWLFPTEKAIVFFRETPSLMHERFVERFDALEEWERLQMLSSLSKLESMLSLNCGPDMAPILDAHPIND